MLNMLSFSIKVHCFIKYSSTGDRRRTIKHHGDLFKGVSLGLRECKPSYNQHHNIKAAEEDVVMPPDIIKCDRVHKC